MINLLTKVNLTYIFSIIFLVAILVHLLLIIYMNNSMYKLLNLNLLVLMIGIIWIILDAEFLGFILMIIYAGIMQVLFLSLIITFNSKALNNSISIRNHKFQKYFIKAGVVATILVLIFGYIIKDYVFTINFEVPVHHLADLINLLLADYNLLLVLIGIFFLGAIITLVHLNLDHATMLANNLVITKKSNNLTMVDRI